MNIKKVILPAFAVIVIGAGIVGGSPVNAQTVTPTQTVSKNNFFNEMVDFIAQKFGLDKAKVQSAMTEFHDKKKSEIQQNMQQREQDRLTKLVSEGKITETQKQAILTKLSSLKDKINADTLKNMTPQERKQYMQTQRDELKSWAQSQGIDPKVLQPGLGRRGGWMRNDVKSAPNP
jgi:uncharacterized protein (DUF433 family)